MRNQHRKITRARRKNRRNIRRAEKLIKRKVIELLEARK